VTSNPDFKVTILFNVKKLENVDRAILIMADRRINRKSYTVYGTAPFSITLNDP